MEVHCPTLRKWIIYFLVDVTVIAPYLIIYISPVISSLYQIFDYNPIDEIWQAMDSESPYPTVPLSKTSPCPYLLCFSCLSLFMPDSDYPWMASYRAGKFTVDGGHRIMYYIKLNIHSVFNPRRSQVVGCCCNRLWLAWRVSWGSPSDGDLEKYGLGMIRHRIMRLSCFMSLVGRPWLSTLQTERSI